VESIYQTARCHIPDIVILADFISPGTGNLNDAGRS